MPGEDRITQKSMMGSFLMRTLSPPVHWKDTTEIYVTVPGLQSFKDYVKVHALVHNLLHVSVCRNMIRYAWCAARLITCEVFCSVNHQFAFLDVVKLQNASAASKHSFDFHGVANCKFLCFRCLYKYYPELCKLVTLVRCFWYYFDNEWSLTVVKDSCISNLLHRKTSCTLFVLKSE